MRTVTLSLLAASGGAALASMAILLIDKHRRGPAVDENHHVSVIRALEPAQDTNQPTMASHIPQSENQVTHELQEERPRLASQEKPANPSAYSDLGQDAEFIRLLEIKPHLTQDGLLDCELYPTSFSKKPQYECLSYAWGDISRKQLILLNGRPFEVGQNLYDALHQFRASPRPGLLWVDFLCINQDNRTERARQIRIMPAIYFRAARVVVWLGSKYSIYSDQLDHLVQDPGYKGHADEVGRAQSSDCDEKTREADCPRTLGALITEVTEDNYWTRLWIVQEIGKARCIEVCLGRHAFEWEKFIKWAVPSDTALGRTFGPANLEKQRQEKQRSGQNLLYLLENHRHAMCQEPRDKIYGLLGLAIDVKHFPVDYDKPLLSVWADTVNYLLQKTSIDASQCIHVCDLVRSILGGVAVEKPEVDLHSIATSNVRIGFKVEVLGLVLKVGPSLTDMINSVGKAEQWNDQLQDTLEGYPKQMWNNAQMHSQTESLLATAYDSPQHAMVGLLQPGRIQNIHRQSNVGDSLRRKIERLRKYGRGKETGRSPEKLNGTLISQVGRIPRDVGRGIVALNTQIAIVSANVREGDVVVRLLSVDSSRAKRIVLRQELSYMGNPSGIPESVSGVISDSPMDKPSHFGVDDYENEVIEIGLDASTLYAVLY